MMTQATNNLLDDAPKKFLFLSSCTAAWGGSEELWSSAALRLAEAGHHVHAFKTFVDRKNSRIKHLRATGITIEDYGDIPISRTKEVMRRLMPYRWKRTTWAQKIMNHASNYLCDSIALMQPNLVVISQGDNFDACEYFEVCRRAKIPYVIISQKASEKNWPHDSQRDAIRTAFCSAKVSFFVSEHNRKLTEVQVGTKLPNSEVVRNPFLTSVDSPLTWPNSSDGKIRLACVARMYLRDKGQDILLNVLAQDKWKQRPLEVTFYGEGVHAEGIKNMAEFFDIKNVHFGGFTSDITNVWRSHHGLVLPSRAEGLPLALVEAMLCGRPAILTSAGGNAELVDDNETGFIASSACPEALDVALERAWQRRDDWEEIGKLAAERIRARVPKDPAEIFAKRLLAVC